MESRAQVRQWIVCAAFGAISVIAAPSRAQSLLDPVVTQVAAGQSHSCAVTSAGGVKCWGDNAYGQLGDGTKIARSVPVAVSGLASGVVSVATGDGHSCAVLKTGAVKCWGQNNFGQLGNNDATLTDSAVPVSVVDNGNVPIGGAVSIGAGAAHTCILDLLGSVECWGNNGDGELGPPNVAPFSSVPVSVETFVMPADIYVPIAGIVSIAVGSYHACALTTGGDILCWGINSYGQLGNGEGGGNTLNAYNPYRALTRGASAISAGGYHTCAAVAATVRCWGANSDGQLGNGSQVDSGAPVVVVDANYNPLNGVTGLSSGLYHNCAVLAAGSVRCWGANFFGQLATSTAAFAYPNAIPAVEADGSPIAGIGSVAAGGNHTCAVTLDGGVRCWGQDNAGEVGTGASESAPQVVAGLGGGVVKVSSGVYQSCALTAAGTIWCWGNNLDGQLGNGTNQISSSPVQVAGLGGVSAVAVGGYHTCALVSGGVKCWGSGPALGNNGNGFDSYTPVQVVDASNTPISGATAVASGQGHSCALLGGGTVKCWGDDSFGQLGNNDPALATQRVAVDVVDNGNVPISGVTAIAAGQSHSCAVKAGGVLCWGDNVNGELGINNVEITSSLTPLAVVDGNGPIGGVSAVSAGASFTCARLGSGGAKCWGTNYDGQLGNNTQGSPIFGAVDVLDTGANPLTGVASLSTGYLHACVITTAGAAKCWGYNGYGELGNSASLTNLVATAVVDARNSPITGLSTLAAGVISGGAYHTCARTQAGAALCWGLNNFGQLGRGFFNSTPRAVASFSGSASSIATGDSHTCAATPAGSVKCWGFNLYGQLGNNDGSGANKLTPVSVVAAAGPAELGLGGIAAGADHSCALDSAGGVECWGDNSNGQLGNNDSSGTKKSTPVAVVDAGNAPVTGIVAVAAGAFHTCALQASGRILCWGDNGNGQLGNNDVTLANRYTPVNVVDATNAAVGGAIAIAAGGYFTCALFTGGAVKCWGDNTKAQLGMGSTGGQSLIPVSVMTLGSGVAAIATGVFHACAVTGAGAAKCWGFNSNGQLGDGSTMTRNAPVAVSGLGSGVAKISAGQFHTCAAIAGGGAKCWGDDSKGQLGINTIGGQSSVPVSVSGLGSVTSLAAGGLHSCALTTAGAVRCWGYNNAGQIGDGTTTNRPLPVGLLDGQNISFNPPKAKGLGTLTLGAVATSGQATTFDTWTPSICTVNGSILTAIAYGVCGVRASQAGNTTTIAAAPQQLRVIAISNEIFADGFQ